jgi:hypothetical protein
MEQLFLCSFFLYSKEVGVEEGGSIGIVTAFGGFFHLQGYGHILHLFL